MIVSDINRNKSIPHCDIVGMNYICIPYDLSDTVIFNFLINLVYRIKNKFGSSSKGMKISSLECLT